MVEDVGLLEFLKGVIQGCVTFENCIEFVNGLKGVIYVFLMNNSWCIDVDVACGVVINGILMFMHQWMILAGYFCSTVEIWRSSWV